MLFEVKVKSLGPRTKKTISAARNFIKNNLFIIVDFLLILLKFYAIMEENTKRSIPMAVSYNKLWKKLIDMNMTKTDLRIATDMSTTTLAKLGKNEIVSMDVLLRICKTLNCNLGDIIDVTSEN